LAQGLQPRTAAACQRAVRHLASRLRPRVPGDLARRWARPRRNALPPHSRGRCIARYQTVTPLKVGELWAIPIMLRLALIENLRRVGARIAAGTIDRGRAGEWADQMLEVAQTDPKSLILVIADMARSNPPMV